MPIGGDDGTCEYRLTEEDMEGDLDMTVREDELDEKGRPLIDWVNPVEWLLPNAEVYGEEEIEEDDDEDVEGEEEDVEGEQEDVEGW